MLQLFLGIPELFPDYFQILRLSGFQEWSRERNESFPTTALLSCELNVKTEIRLNREFRIERREIGPLRHSRPKSSSPLQ